MFFHLHSYFEMAHHFVFIQQSPQTIHVTNPLLIVSLLLPAPPDMPEITGYSNGSTVFVHVGTAITLVCRADHGDSTYTLTWTNGTHEIHDGTRSDIICKIV